MSPDIAASVRARLLNRAKRTKEEFEFVLVRYACERFLYRLGESELRDRCILKGAGLLTLWMQDPYRATRDIDLLARGASSEPAVRELVVTICSIPCLEDGLTFDLGSLVVSELGADQEYQGHRVVLRAFLAGARVRLQVDFGFGDAVSPSPEEAEYPTLVAGIPAPRVRAYPREASLAEKLDAMIRIGRRNSRMKDFHDVWSLSSAFGFDGPVLRQSVVACFERRGTPWAEELPDALSPAFYDDAGLQARWTSYLRAGAFQAPPPSGFETIGERVRAFFGPVRDSVVRGSGFELRWQPGGRWE